MRVDSSRQSVLSDLVGQKAWLDLLPRYTEGIYKLPDCIRH